MTYEEQYSSNADIKEESFLSNAMARAVAREISAPAGCMDSE